MIVLNFLYALLSFVLLLAVLIIVHEFGHYLAGRLQGFAIDAFSVGFGPKLLEVKGKYNPWQFRWILLGGYVKFREEVGEGGGAGEEAPSQLQGPGEPFFKKKRWQRLIVMIMGVTFNALLAYGIYSSLAMYGMEESVLRDQAPVIGWVAPNLPAAKAGIEAGDLLYSLDGRHVSNWDQAREQIYTLTLRPYNVVVIRDGRKRTFRVAPETVTMMHQPMGEIGVFPQLPPVIGAVATPSPAEAAGIQPGDRIVSVDGERFQYWDQFYQAMLHGGGSPRRFTIERGGKLLNRTITPEWNAQAGRYLIGVVAQESTWVRYPFPSNLGKAWRMIADQSTLTYRAIQGLFQRKISLQSMQGPVSIAYITAQAVRAGFYSILYWLALISLQLALVNLLPVPGLDGGQILILAVEGAIRRDLPTVVKERIIMAGFALVMVFFAVVLFVDTAKFFH